MELTASVWIRRSWRDVNLALHTEQTSQRRPLLSPANDADPETWLLLAALTAVRAVLAEAGLVCVPFRCHCCCCLRRRFSASIALNLLSSSLVYETDREELGALVFVEPALRGFRAAGTFCLDPLRPDSTGRWRGATAPQASVGRPAFRDVGQTNGPK